MPSTDQACVPVPECSDRAPRGGGGARCQGDRIGDGIGRLIFASVLLPACRLQKYDNRIVGSHDGERPLAAASRLTADDRRVPHPQLSEALTPKFAQNNSEIDGPGFHLVNFASAVFLREHLLIRPGVCSSNRGVARR